MGLAFYDENQDPFGSDPMRTFHDGHLGGPHEQVFYLRNDDSGRYYTNVSINFENLQVYQDLGELGTSGWGVKFMFGQRRPTEAEWDLVRSGDSIAIPDIGTTIAADTSTYHPIWARVFCPGDEAAQIRENQRVRVRYFDRKVGA